VLNIFVIVILVGTMALLMGDSIFSRLLSQYRSGYHPLSEACCVSGIKVGALKALAKSLTEIPSSVVLLVGINDLTSPHDLSNVWRVYLSLVNLLLRRGVDNVYVCPLLPVANKCLQHRCGSARSQFNFWIRGLCQKRGVSVISFDHIFFQESGVKADLYCPKIKNRPDYLHPNRKGLSQMHMWLQQSIV